VSSLGRPTTGLADGPARPMTGIRGAGYPGTAQGRPGANGGLFDPLNQAARAAASSSGGLEKKAEETPEEKIKSLERRVTDLVEESCLAASRRENKMALDRAKEASAKVTRWRWTGPRRPQARYGSGARQGQGGLCQGKR
jgi:intraflagellar transport protein 88